MSITHEPLSSNIIKLNTQFNQAATLAVVTLKSRTYLSSSLVLEICLKVHDEKLLTVVNVR